MKVLLDIGFNFLEPIEYENLFNLFNDDGKVKLTNLNNVLLLDPIDVKNSAMSLNKMSSWKDRIISFDTNKANEYKKTFNHLLTVFKDIRKKLVDKVEKIEELFNGLIVSIDGECDEMEFIHVLGKYSVQKSSYFINFLDFFRNKKSKRFELLTFINGYNAIFFDNGESQRVLTDVSEGTKNNQNLSKSVVINNTEKKQAANTITSNLSPNPNLTNTNMSKTNPNLPKKEKVFSDDDLEYIKDVVNFIAPIIFEEKKKTIIEFFNGYDKLKVGYFTKDTFMRILDDLDVDTKDVDELAVLLIFLIL